MKKSIAALTITIGLVLASMVIIGAQTTPISPLENPFIGALEVDFQIDLTSGPEIDVGFMWGKYFHIGGGFSFIDMENQPLLGGYLKLGSLTFDILKAKYLCDPYGSIRYMEIKAKGSFLLLPKYKYIPLPLSAGLKYSELRLMRDGRLVYSSQLAPFCGVDVTLNNSKAEIWLELQFPYEISCRRPPYARKEELHFVFGFAGYF